MSLFRPWGLTIAEAVDAYLNDGAIPERFLVHKFGHNPTCAAGDTVWGTGGAYPYLTYTGTPLAMRVKAGGDAADDTGGTGARSVTIQGLDGNFAIASETVTTAGISASLATTTTFSRVLRVFVETAGTGRTNAANIVIEDSGGAADYATILAGEGQGEIGFVTVPDGYTGYLTEITITTSIASGSGTLAISAMQRGNANETEAPFTPKRLFWQEHGLSRDSGISQVRWTEPIKFQPLTDIWFECTPSTGTPEVDLEFTMLFERDRA